MSVFGLASSAQPSIFLPGTTGWRWLSSSHSYRCTASVIRRFLTRQAARILDDDSLLYLSFPDRVQQQTGWNAYRLWATIYPWIASDVSFVGVLVVVFLIGRLFAQSWLDSLMLRNPFAVAIFAQFIIMLFYFNANNQCLQDGEGISTFWVLLVLWRSSRPSAAARRRRPNYAYHAMSDKPFQSGVRWLRGARRASLPDGRLQPIR